MVPTTFTQEEIKKAYDYVISKVKKNSRFVGNKVLGSPYVYYKEIADLLNYEIECEGDGDRLGIISGEISNLEIQESGLLLSAVIISKNYKRPGSGFYLFATNKGYFNLPDRKLSPDGYEELDFWNKQVTSIVKRYGKSK